MDANRFDQISKLFATRRLSRRRALVGAGGAGFAVTGMANAQDATPDATPSPGDVDRIPYLFVQSFQSGTIAPTEGAAGRYTVTLDHGLGQTIYFADRPSRDVGITPTPQFLEGLGFTEDEPPNAALLVETTPGETEISVVELYNPTYSPDDRMLTYEVAVLQNWNEELDLQFQEAPSDLAALAPSFGTAHLLIDDCPSHGTVDCYIDGDADYPPAGSFDVPTCWNFAVCIPCEPYGHDQPSRCATQDYWTKKCNETFDKCDDEESGPCEALFAWYLSNSWC